ncbi:hypothetical protein Tco_0211775 [Tanacetum coccineum]
MVVKKKKVAFVKRPKKLPKQQNVNLLHEKNDASIYDFKPKGNLIPEKKCNNLKDFLNVAGPMGVAHFLMPSKTISSPDLRVESTTGPPVGIFSNCLVQKKVLYPFLEQISLAHKPNIMGLVKLWAHHVQNPVAREETKTTRLAIGPVSVSMILGFRSSGRYGSGRGGFQFFPWEMNNAYEEIGENVNLVNLVATTSTFGEDTRINILVKCDHVKNSVMATTNEHGAFETQLPSSNCQAKILGGPKQLYVSRKNMITSIMNVHETDSYTTSQPLSIYTSCPLSKNGKCGTQNDAVGRNIGSSKTIDVPLPKEWGLAPSSYYVPFLPIIGIP